MMTDHNYSLDLTVQVACDALDIPARAQLKKWIEAALDRQATITVRFVDSVEGAQLNRDYRQKDYATNVLTFPYVCDDTCEADLVLCPEVVLKEANEQQKSVSSHYAHLIIHGTLHAIGYGHETEDIANEMETKEIEILTSLGFDDPYQDRTVKERR